MSDEELYFLMVEGVYPEVDCEPDSPKFCGGDDLEDEVNFED